MDLRTLLINDAGRPRSGWRLALFVLAFVGVFFILSSFLRVIYALTIYFGPGVSSRNLEDLGFRLLLVTSALVAGYMCTRWLEGLPWRALGLWFHANWLRDLLIGSAIGFASLALAVAIAGAGLSLSFSPINMFPAVFKTLVFSAVLFIVAALAEEALFRGYPLQTFSRARLAWVGVLLTSLPFAAAHLDNPNAGSWLASANTAMAGVWLAVAYLTTRSLLFPLGVHWGWNWALGSIFGLPVSGTTKLAPNPLMHGVDLGPVWLTGGDYG
ncbi:MAG: lysostaphin resistance A-like protein, partial [Pyrinomonadaceae bacterium]